MDHIEHIQFININKLDRVERAIFVGNMCDYTDWLIQKEFVTENEAQGLVGMFKSPDLENVELAIEIIQLKKPNQNGNNIHS